jgi:Zn-dependent protease with chaperone function
MRKLILALATAAVAATAVAVIAASAPPAAPEPRSNDPRFTVQVTDEMRRHSTIEESLYFVGTAYSLLVLAFLLKSGAARRMRDLSLRATKKPFVVAMLTVALFVLATTLLELPLTYYADFVVPHQFDLSDQSLGSWLLDGAKGLAVSLVLSAVVGALALLAMRRVRRWWLALWLGSIPLILLMVVVQPIVLDPIFNKFEPLQNQELKAKLLDLASRAGIEGGRVYQVNKSKQTKTMNAYVNGIGPTKRIVLWDTLLAKMTDDEILAVMGHEMGHYVLNHMWKGLAFGLAVSFVVFFAGQKIYDRGIETRGARWGLTGRGDPASLPWLLLIAGVIGFLLSPVTNGFSRHIEHEADIFSLDLTHLNEPMASAFVKFAKDSKRDPYPNRFLEFWRYSHPALGRRIEFALGYKPGDAKK